MPGCWTLCQGLGVNVTATVLLLYYVIFVNCIFIFVHATVSPLSVTKQGTVDKISSDTTTRLRTILESTFLSKLGIQQRPLLSRQQVYVQPYIMDLYERMFRSKLHEIVDSELDTPLALLASSSSAVVRSLFPHRKSSCNSV